jgi:tRNA pseudouridine38-40 synthase
LFLGNEKPIIQKNFVSWIKRDIDIEKLKFQTKFLLGKHDFSAFRSSRCNSNNPIREIKSIEIKQHKKMVFITITANAFLQNMVRIIVGTLIDIAKNEISISLKEIMISKDRKFAGKTMTPSGLFYLGPKYPKTPKINTPKQIQYII